MPGLMNSDPLELALREIADTKRLLEQLITSSETFDYPQAKATLEELQAKVKLLGRTKAALLDLRPEPLCTIIPFPGLHGSPG